MKKMLMAAIMIVLLSQVVFAATLSKSAIEAQDSIIQAEGYIKEMIGANFSTNKVNDTYLLAKQDFDSKVILEQRLIDVKYDTIFVKTSEIKVNRDNAFSTNDELNALRMFLEPYKDKNLTNTFALYDEAKEEFDDERYDESMVAIQKCYNEISVEQSAQTTLKVFYDNTRKGMRNFLMDNWKYIILVIAMVSIIGAITYNRLSVYLIKRRIKHLELEKLVLKELIRDSQSQYFDKGKISETDYHIKIKKFAELIRDIERQVPLLQEQLAKASRTDFTKKSKK